jgi:hypothetical protein
VYKLTMTTNYSAKAVCNARGARTNYDVEVFRDGRYIGKFNVRRKEEAAAWVLTIHAGLADPIHLAHVEADRLDRLRDNYLEAKADYEAAL